MIPAMQIHLFDCKSDQPLRRGLGSNKLSLCMLVLSRLRETYWSASVIHRLFERAQAILGDSHFNMSETAQSQNPAPHRQGYHSGNQSVIDNEHYRQQYHRQERQHEHQHHQQDDNNRDEEEVVSMPPIDELTHIASEQVAPSWLNGSFAFSTVDQLLSPGFSISESAFPSVFMGYTDDILGAYDQIVPLSNQASINPVYNV